MSDSRRPERPGAATVPAATRAATPRAAESQHDERGNAVAAVAESPAPTLERVAKFLIGQVVKHRFYPFRGVIFDVDPTFNNTEEWWMSIPEAIRPRKDQPFYHVLAENETSHYIAYVSEQNLQPDETGKAVRHPQVPELFGALKGGLYEPKHRVLN